MQQHKKILAEEVIFLILGYETGYYAIKGKYVERNYRM